MTALSNYGGSLLHPAWLSLIQRNTASLLSVREPGVSYVLTVLKGNFSQFSA